MRAKKVNYTRIVASILKKIAILLASILLKPFKHIVLKGNVIILQTYSPYIYCENTRYLYEYLSEYTDYDVYWVTDSIEIQQYLDSISFKYISKRNILKLIYITLRAKVIVDSGSYYFNPFKLVTKKVIKISTMHGSGPKAVASVYDNLKDNLELIYALNSFDFVNFPSEHSLKKSGRTIYHILPSKLVNLGYPRCDQFFDKEHVKERYNKKEVANYLLDGCFVQGGKIVVYTPTYRPYVYNFLLEKMEGINLQKFNDFLEEKNIYFFYTLHTIDSPKSLPSDLSRIKGINHKRYPFFDINQFMLEADILLNDYSTTSTDFCILERPQIFFMPDYKYYDNCKGFCDDYLPIIPGIEIHNYHELKMAIIKYLNNSEIYRKEFGQKCKNFLKYYYDVSNLKSCERFKQFIAKKMSTV